jgi:hypothetical protein
MSYTIGYEQLESLKEVPVFITEKTIMKKRQKRLIRLLLLLVSFVAPPTIAGEIYSYLDANGVRVYTDKMPVNRSRLKVYSPPSSESAKSRSAKIYKCIDSKGVIHYTDKPKSSCYQLIYLGGSDIPPFSSFVESDDSLSKKSEHYKTLIQDVATGTRLEPALLHAVIQTESAYNPNAVSPKGAVGLMQLMPATAKRFGVTDRRDAASNVYGGARYLRHLLELFNHNLELALAAYNAGENAVKRYNNQIPPYRETRNYVKKVMRLYRAYQAKM